MAAPPHWPTPVGRLCLPNGHQSGSHLWRVWGAWQGYWKLGAGIDESTSTSIEHVEIMPRIIECQKCGHENTAKLKSCISCGEMLATPEWPATPKEPPSKLMGCPDCGREISINAPACPGCGAPIASAQTVVKRGDTVPYSPQEVAVMLSRKPNTSHLLHLILSLLTLGLWVIVWIIVAVSNSMESSRIDDEIAEGKGFDNS